MRPTPDKLHDLKATLDSYQVYSQDQLDELVGNYLENSDRDPARPNPRRLRSGLPGAVG